MSLIYTSTGEKWRGERIGGVAHPRSIEQLWTPEQLAALGLEKAPAPTPTPVDIKIAINNERDRRIAAGCEFGGHVFQTDAVSKQRLLALSLRASKKIAENVQANDMRWLNPNVDFTYISADNVAVPMDAVTLYALGEAVADRESFLVYRARTLKDTPGGFTGDPTADEHWT